MNVPIFIHESNDSVPLPCLVVRPATEPRPRSDRRPVLRHAAENAGIEDAEKTTPACTAEPRFAASAGCPPKTCGEPASALPGEPGAIYRFDQADYAMLARRYSALLRRGMTDNTMAGEQRAFCRQMLDQLEEALARCSATRAQGLPSDARFDAEMEIQWLCNQCEECFGAATSAELSSHRPRQTGIRTTDRAATDGELAAVSGLFATVRIAAGRSADRAAWLRHGGGALNILGHNIREASARAAAWLRRRAAAAKDLVRRAGSRQANG